LFEKVPVFEALRDTPLPNSELPSPNQRTLWDL
jgi:hypothetical protein